ncbi:MAG: hypothetical protein MZV49_21855 [Rhodopseudomonas palustris]|nr:hypothetical protein [Rhodopseudomonas palustris]
MAARVIRLAAETDGKNAVEFPEELLKVAPRAVQSERAVFEAHMRKLAQDIDVVQQQETQKTKEIDELRATEKRYTESLALLNRELALTRKLCDREGRAGNRDAARRSAGHRHARPARGGAGLYCQDRVCGAGGARPPAQHRHRVSRPGRG